MAATKTLQNMRDVLYAVLKEDEDTSAYPLVLADALMNSIQQDICAGVITDLTSWNLDQLEKWPLPFLFSDSYFTSVQDTYLTATTSIWATTLNINDTTNFASSGDLWINEDLVTYTGKTATTFTGVTGVDFAHLWGARVTQLFSLADDFASSVRVIYNWQLVLQPVDYRNLYLKLNNYKGTGYVNNSNNSVNDRFTDDLAPFYTIINGTYFLPFQIDNSGYMFHQIYEKTPTALSDGADLLTIPDRYSQVTIPILAAADILYNRWEEDRALKLHRFWLWKVNSMYSFYASQNSEDLNWQRVQTGKDQIYNI